MEDIQTWPDNVKVTVEATVGGRRRSKTITFSATDVHALTEVLFLGVEKKCPNQTFTAAMKLMLAIAQLNHPKAFGILVQPGSDRLQVMSE